MVPPLRLLKIPCLEFDFTVRCRLTVTRSSSGIKLGPGVWRGISLNDWNDTIHVKNDTHISSIQPVPSPYVLGTNAVYPSTIPSDLNERGRVGDTCRRTATCAVRAYALTRYYITPLLEPFIDTVSPYGPNI